MLIRTIEDWETGMVVILSDGETIVCRHPEGVGVIFGDDRPLSLDFLKDFFPATLIHPRRYGDEELGAVAAAIETRRQLNPHADSIALARAALKTLEEDQS